MTDNEKKRTKIQSILPLADAEELISFLTEKKGNQKIMCKKLGISRQSASGWIKNKEFPQYCLPYLEQIRVMKQWAGEKK